MADAATQCVTSNDYDGRMGLRISSIFVILVGSTFGTNHFALTCQLDF